MKRLMPRQYAKILYELTANLKNEPDISAAVRAFVGLLQTKHAIGQGEAIVEAFAAYADEQSGKMPVMVTTARPLESSAKKFLQEQLGAVIKSEMVDETIIGGVVVKATSVLFDASIRGQLQRLQQQLVK